jgi:hypothetical protein
MRIKSATARRRARSDTFGLDRVRGPTKPCGVDEGDTKAFKIDHFGDQIPRSARHVGTMARAVPTSALNTLDLPTFGLPTMATCIPSRTIRPRLPAQ